MVQTDEERKAKRKEYRNRPEVKARRKELSQTPENKEKAKTHRKKYRDRPENKEKRKEYESTLEFKAKRKEYQSTPENKEKLKKYRDSTRFKMLQYYSKYFSNSDIPCCRCCGESHIEFLAIDHIAGRKEMDSEPELVKLGYSSSLVSNKLYVWIIKNNFPKGFQVLCHNCNLAKGFYGNCPHEK